MCMCVYVYITANRAPLFSLSTRRARETAPGVGGLAARQGGGTAQTSMHIHIYIYMHDCVYIYIYIYIGLGRSPSRTIRPLVSRRVRRIRRICDGLFSPTPSRNQIKAGARSPTQKMATSIEVELSPSSLLSYFHSVEPSSRTSLHLQRAGLGGGGGGGVRWCSG